MYICVYTYIYIYIYIYTAISSYTRGYNPPGKPFALHRKVARLGPGSALIFCVYEQAFGFGGLGFRSGGGGGGVKDFGSRF